MYSILDGKCLDIKSSTCYPVEPSQFVVKSN
nr:MAG TPA: hypothetical protein [Bacteriophage sp.]